MGCDIHGTVEVKTDNGWKFVSPLLYDGRNYDAFCRLAGVRCYNRIDRDRDMVQGESDGIIPDDASDTTRKEYEAWDWDAHSPNTMPAQEFIDIIQDTWYNTDAVKEWLGIDKVTLFIKENKLDDFRVIMWFDD